MVESDRFLGNLNFFYLTWSTKFSVGTEVIDIANMYI